MNYSYTNLCIGIVNETFQMTLIIMKCGANVWELDV